MPQSKRAAVVETYLLEPEGQTPRRCFFVSLAGNEEFCAVQKKPPQQELERQDSLLLRQIGPPEA